jgi:DNA-binding transcriptional LysR family regulator
VATLDRLEINALRTLVVVHDAGSFTEAARRMGVSQSTVSYIAKQLRQAFEDPLFVRSGNSVQATPRCIEIVAEVRPVLVSLSNIANKGQFEPATAIGDITVSCNFHERRFLLPDAIARIRSDAPGLRLHLHEAAVEGKSQLAANLVDIALGPVAMLGDIFYRRALFTDRYVCVMHPTNPLAEVSLTLDRYRDAQHLMVTHNGRWEAIFLSRLRERGIDLEPSVSVPSHDSIGKLLADSDLVATIPERLALDLGQKFVVRPFPFEVPIEIDMYWTERTHMSAAHAWVRQILADTSRDLMQRARSKVPE